MASSSGGGLSRKQSLSSAGKRSLGKLSSASHRQTPPPTTLTPDNSDAPFEPCAATASFLLYAQRNRVLVVHQDTLAIERRFDLHREDVVWIAVDNVSERGQGRLAVSYDAGNTAIVWDILTGGEIARFSAYESIRAASFIRNGNIAFGELMCEVCVDRDASLMNTAQVMTMAISSCLSRQPRNMSRRGQSTMLSRPLRRLLIVEHLRLGG